ncbi:G1/S-specific cyclin-E1 [Tetranychus urticae]|uniref:Uncharacterized protein n=1 Tax=Tetranychus urticae TaxID=32264 RepID=T1KU45_TETUR|nr:G1/S-specific cyclin-E1 [Tetranychus urticae]
MENQDGFLTPNCAQSSRRVRPSPLPQLNMSDPAEMWESMITSDENYHRDPHMLSKHPHITPRMRSILLDWLSEVSELFKLHRETYYFALDFVDRYLSVTKDIPRQQLQLIGITCLFIAAKIEEVYPPPVSNCFEVTDDACLVEEIIAKELVIMESLKWNLHPITVNKWLSIFMQIYSILEKENNVDPQSLSTGEKFLMPNYSGTFFSQVAHLVDLCMLDFGSLQFNYDVIAASAFYHFTNEHTVYSCTRFKYSDIRECVIWMTPFALAVRETGFTEPKVQVEHPFWSNMKYHTADLTLLERAHTKQVDLAEEASSESSSSMPPSPVTSSPYAQSKIGQKRKRETSPTIRVPSSPKTASSISSSSSPTPSTSSTLTPSSVYNKQNIGSNKRKRDLNNNRSNYDDTDDSNCGNEKEVHSRGNVKRCNKKRRSISPSKSSF